jgi:hypothetical protein
MRPLLRLIAVGVGVIVSSSVAWAAPIVWMEQGDAGQLPGVAQQVFGGVGDTLTTITGSLSTIDDADMFALRITNTATFSATTVGGTTIDTQLFLFNSAGQGVLANDDVSTMQVQSTLPAGPGAATNWLGPGMYFLLISSFGRDPQSVAGLIFPNSITGAFGATGPGGGANVITGLTGLGSNNGPYQISLTSASPLPSSAAIPEPTSALLLGSGLAALSARRRLKRSERRLKLSR